MEAFDVVIVGGGVAGCAIAGRLAGSGHRVLVLEREERFTDRIRGEGFGQYGFDQVTALGLADVVLAVPAMNVATRVVPYDEALDIATAEQAAVARNVYCCGHPDLRERLAVDAAGKGAVVQRGVDEVSIRPGARPTVAFRTPDGAGREVGARLVIGADGKDSAVRRQLGFELSSTRARVVLTGLLVDDGGAWDRDVVTVGVQNRWKFYIQPRGDHLVRLYLGRAIGDADGLSGTDRTRRFLDTFDFSCLPYCDAFRAAIPKSICAGHPMTDSWPAASHCDGVVLAGDAAGWSDPIIGQGLTVAFRDARVLTDLLLEHHPWDAAVLDAYHDERSERMRRLRFVNAFASLFDQLDQPSDERLRRRERMGARLAAEPELGRARAVLTQGPWAVPADAFEPAIITALATA